MYLEDTEEDKEFLECFDEALWKGISAIFYTYEEDEDDLDIIH